MKTETFEIERAGRAIFVRRWSPDDAPRAVIQIAHGLAEHSARYERVAQALTAAGYVVAASDHRGHGPKCPPADLGYFADSDGWRACLTDLEAVAHQLRRDYPGLPVVFFGHSMGSFMGQTYIAEHGAELAAAVLSGTSGPAPAILADRAQARRVRALAPRPARQQQAGRSAAFRRTQQAVQARAHAVRLAFARRGRGRQIYRRSALRLRRQPINSPSTCSRRSATSPRRRSPRASRRACRFTSSAARAIPSAPNCKA